MKRFRVWLLLATIAALVLAGSQFTPKTSSQGPKATRKAQPRSDWTPTTLANYDIRAIQSKADNVALASYRQVTLTAANAATRAAASRLLAAGRSELAARVPGLHVEANQFGTAPEIVGVESGCHCALTAGATGAHEPFVRRFVAANAALYGLTAEQVADLRVVADYANPAGNLSWVEYEQRINNIPVFQGYLRAALTADGRLARTTGNLAAGLDYATLPTTAELTPAAAAVAGAQALNIAADPLSLYTVSIAKGGRTTKLAQGPFTEEIKTELTYFPVEPGVATLAYALTLWLPHDAYYVLVDANDGRLLWRKDIMQEQTQSVTYGIYNDDSPSPLSPTTALPGSGFQPPFIARTNLTLVSELPAFDNLGWITDGGNVTTGNNVDAGLDVDGVNGIDASGRATGSPNRVFNFAYDPAIDAPSSANFRMGAVTNIFFWSNRYHDQLYNLGFTEAARNFQTNNFGRGGTGNDFVRAEAQDSSGTNNANFSTSPDGTPGRMQMFIFTGPNPDRDGDLDGDVFLHELTHGTSNRLHANASGLATTQSGGMGEGWSDYYSRALLASADEDVDAVYAAGGYVTNLIGAGFTDNYYYGIRRFPYAVKTNVGGPTATRPGQPHNPLTFADIDTALISVADGAYNRNPAVGSATANEVHNIGEVWCMMLLEMRAHIIKRMGFAAGNQRALQIVTDGMKLDPASPTILQARDSILAADCAGFGGADEQDIWAGFATRGAGFSSTATGGTTLATDVVEAFDTPNLALGAVTISDTAGNNNGAAEPGEPITLNVPLVNTFCGTDAISTTAAINGGGTGNYGTITHGTTATQPLSYTVPANTACGTRLVLPIVIDSSLGQVTRNYTLIIGQPIIGFSEAFDGLTAPALPAGWTTAHTGTSGVNWVTATTTPASAPNAAFTPDITTTSTSDLVTPGIAINTAAAQLSFKNLFNTESTFDGLTLDISINGGAFTDIVAAGGSFVSGGYNTTMAASSPFGARAAWSGLSAGTTAAPDYITTTVNLPAAVNGQSIKLRWRAGTDGSAVAAGVAGMRIDGITLSTASQCAAVCGFTSQPANITGSNDANACGAIVNFNLPTLSCGGTVTSSPPTGTVFPVGTTTVTVTGTPSGGGANVTTSFTVTINDTQAPVFTSTPADVFVASTNGTNAVVNFAAPTATDNCPGVTVTSVPASGSTFPIGITQVTHTATDAYNNTATTTSNVNVVPQTLNGQLLISEFRFHGPTFNTPGDGALDEYAELYNATNNALTVATSDGSAGFALAALDDAGTSVTKLGTIPAGTVIPARGHYLFAHQPGASGGYSLAAYAAGDTFFPTDITDAGGVALFRTDTAGNFAAASELDAVSFNNAAGALPALYREGTALASPGANDGQYAFVRKLTTGTPQDTGDNAQDFAFVSINGGNYGGVQSTLGAPGPEDSSSLIQRNATLKTLLIEPNTASTAAPNRVRDTTANICNGGTAPSNCTLGTLDIRRRFVNNTGGIVSRLRFRVVDITTLPAGANADLRVIDGANLPITTSRGALTVRGTTIELPLTPASGGGLNSSVTIALPGGTLGVNAPLDVHFTLGVQVGGAFRFLVNIEALP